MSVWSHRHRDRATRGSSNIEPAFLSLPPVIPYKYGLVMGLIRALFILHLDGENNTDTTKASRLPVYG